MTIENIFFFSKCHDMGGVRNFWRNVSFGSMLFYESDFFGAQPESTYQCKIHASSRFQ